MLSMQAEGATTPPRVQYQTTTSLRVSSSASDQSKCAISHDEAPEKQGARRYSSSFAQEGKSAVAMLEFVTTESGTHNR